MKTSVETLSEVEVKVDVEIPATDVDREYQKQLGHFGKRARVKGFRPGKAPRSLIEKTYGPSISAETARALISGSLKDVIDGLERKAIGEPAIEPGVARQGEPLKYAVRVQVKPQIEIHSWEGIEVAVPPLAVGDAAIDAEIEKKRDAHKERVPVEDRAIDTGDIVVADFEGYLDGERDLRLDGTDLEIRIGAGNMIPGFEDQLIGAKVGDAVTVETAFPDDYHHQPLAGKPGRWEVQVKQHFVEEVPEVDDDFAGDLGFDDVAALREDIRAKIAADAEKARTQSIERKVMEVLLERNQFMVPPVMLRAALEERARNVVRMMQMRGIDQKTAIELVNQNVKDLQAAAEGTVRWQLALEAFANQQAIDVDDDDLSAEIVERIERHGESVARLYENPDLRETLRMELIERRALERIVAKARVVDAQPEDGETPPTDDAAAARPAAKKKSKKKEG
ncbi:MAG: trigger factor [Deltaproteobacteria bacterium]|nr:trigger factor [Deltaproteobacteria bacterium]